MKIMRFQSAIKVSTEQKIRKNWRKKIQKI